jgi:hypothetical protein
VWGTGSEGAVEETGREERREEEEGEGDRGRDGVREVEEERERVREDRERYLGADGGIEWGEDGMSLKYI